MIKYDMPHWLPVAETVIGMPKKNRQNRRELQREMRRREARSRINPNQSRPKRRKYHKGGHNKIKK